MTEGFREMLKSLTHEELLEVLLHKGFCDCCQTNLQTKIQSLFNLKMKNISLCSDPSVDKSTDREQQGLTPNVDLVLNDGLSNMVNGNGSGGLSEEQKERIRFSQIGRQKNFVHSERVNGKPTNVVQGLELHSCVFNAQEQNTIVGFVYELQRMGQNGRLRERTYTEPTKWMRGKGRITLQFGCCYNYAVDRNGNPPGILREEEVDPMPGLFKKMIKRLVRWHVLPPTCVPNSCIVNIYDEGDCIPPHIDHHDFLRPFCTVSFLAECNILFGSNLKIVGPGEFSGPVSIPLPLGSVLVLKGNGADIAKHCVPAVPAKRISITFRKMGEDKLPYNYAPDPDLRGIKPLLTTASPVQQNLQHYKPVGFSAVAKSQVQEKEYHRSVGFSAVAKSQVREKEYETSERKEVSQLVMSSDDFPPLGSATPSGHRSWPNKTRPKH